MYVKIIAVVITALCVLFTIWYVCRRDTDGRRSSRTGHGTGRIRDHVEDAGRRNSDIEAAERRTADLIREQAAAAERAGQGNKDAQQLVKKAKHILHSAKHTDSSN